MDKKIPVKKLVLTKETIKIYTCATCKKELPNPEIAGLENKNIFCGDECLMSYLDSSGDKF